MAETWIIAPDWVRDVLETQYGKVPSVPYTPTTETKKNILAHIDRSVQGGKIFQNDVIATYTLVHTVANAYAGGVLAPNGDIHFVPRSTNRGQKIAPNGTVSTYSLVYTVASAYSGGALSPNGDIHFVPLQATIGQKIDINGTVSTYTLVYSLSTGAYLGGVLAPNGEIHFVPTSATIGQKILADLGIKCISPLGERTPPVYASDAV